MASNFCPVSYTLLEEITSGNVLKFKSPKTGTVYEATPENTMLASEEVGEIHSVSKYKNTLKVSAYDPINPRIRLADGCENCGRKVVSYQRLGAEKRVFFACLCGKQWHH
jgi:DNA-directed RNA polymerase subunit M/transcription elongation factor TFIIS